MAISIVLLLLLLSSYHPILQGPTNVYATSRNATPTSLTPIKHIVIMVQENHAFDNYFGVFPGVQTPYALNTTVCIPKSLSNSSLGCIKPWNADQQSSFVNSYDLIHAWTAAHGAFHQGQLNGFYQAQVTGQASYPNFTMAYYTNRTVPNYWNYASYYALDANFYSDILSFSYPNHLYTVAAQSGGIVNRPVLFNLTFKTITDELTAANIDWKYYAFNWNDSLDCQSMNLSKFAKNTNDLNLFEQVLIDFPHVQQNTAECHNLLNGNDLMQNLSAGYLPQVSYILPNKTQSEHPHTSGPNGLVNGQLYTASIINAISENPSLWNSTAIFLTWDDWGGYYDNAVPHQVDQYGLGFRVPLIVISPYVIQGKIFYGVNGAQEGLSSLLSTIEANWGLPSLTNRDQYDPSLFYMFNFSQKLLPPLIMPSNILSIYPYQSCVNQGYCHIGYKAPYSSPTPFVGVPAPNLSPTQLQQEALFAGDGDPYD